VNKQVLVIYREADRVLPYRDALLAAGLNPVMREANGPLSISGSDGPVLTGGPDVDPALYGETRQAETEQPDGVPNVAGAGNWRVNSRHHQAVKTVAGNLRVAAFDPEDRTVGALDHPDRRFVLGVQWHPEDQARIDPGQLKIFRSFRRGNSLRGLRKSNDILSRG